jgi:hypothetical protein
MTSETTNRKQLAAITSDQWHVVHAQRRKANTDRRPYERTIVSEHSSRKLAEASASDFRVRVAADSSGLGQDAVFVRKPNYKTLKFSKKLAPGQ